jgi:hypothetical protein
MVVSIEQLRQTAAPDRLRSLDALRLPNFALTGVLLDVEDADPRTSEACSFK